MRGELLLMPGGGGATNINIASSVNLTKEKKKKKKKPAAFGMNRKRKGYWSADPSTVRRKRFNHPTS